MDIVKALRSIVAAAVAALACGPALASSTTDQMLKLSPETRLEQRCNARAMGIVGREHKGFHPDEFVAYAFADTQIDGSGVVARGGALRSGGNWYHITYQCRTTPDGLTITSFAYDLGAVVPKAEWSDHYLVP